MFTCPLASLLELTYYSLEIGLVLTYWFLHGSNQWQGFNQWSAFLCSRTSPVLSSTRAAEFCPPSTSSERDALGFEVEQEVELPEYCRRGSTLSSVVFQVLCYIVRYHPDQGDSLGHPDQPAGGGAQAGTGTEEQDTATEGDYQH